MPNPLRTADRLDGLGVTLLRRVLAEAPDDAISLGLGMSNIDVPPAIQAALAASSALGRASYGPNAGEPALRTAIAEKYGVEAGRVLVTCGVQEGIALAILGTVNPGDEVVVPDPGFPVYANLTRIAGGTPVAYSPRAAVRFRPTWDDIAPLCTERTRMVVLCSPGNPTGATATPEAFARIGEECAARGVLLLSDEIYDTLQHSGPVHGTMLAHNPDALVLSGLSKSHGLAGWRLGWLIAPSPMVPALTALHQHLVTSASTVVQQAALGAFTEAGQAAVRALAASLLPRRQRAVETLQAAGWEVAAGDGAFYLWIRHAEHTDALALCRRLMHEARVVTLPGHAFGAAGHAYLRISYSVTDDVLDEALQRITAWSAG